MAIKTVCGIYYIANNVCKPVGNILVENYTVEYYVYAI